uniref:pyridoxamine 5'-phosphate oxidase n=1 Tax=uncultured Acinetobacter sp. TaxID=165433 RepID=UPI00261909EA|nr:pyridoxamine 5'-phosphate oxidase [uncultured Acinetobacter sp.]
MSKQSIESSSIKDLSELRLSYQRGELHEDHVAPIPHEQFLLWFNQALTCDLHEPYAMYLATANAQALPHVRTVLLRGATNQGYDFYSNYDSEKGLDLAENPQAQILFYWAELEQQVRISGRVEKISEIESTSYYHKRPRDSQIAAHVSTPQSGVIESREALQQRFDDAVQQFENIEQLDKPKFWGGYRLVPDYYEFWQGRPNRLHDRICYQKQGEDWVIQRLMP